MKVLMISTDRKIFEPDSSVSKRMAAYGSAIEELHIVVLSKRGPKYLSLSHNVFVYSTNSFLRAFAHRDAVGLCMRIIRERNLSDRNAVITVSDPFETARAGITVKNKTGIALEVQVHTEVFNPHFADQSVRNYVRKLMAPKAFAKADKVRVVSYAIEETLLTHNVSKDKISTIPIPIREPSSGEVDDIKSRFPGFSFFVLWVGRLEPEKDILTAIEVIRDVSNRGIALVVVGDGSMRKEAERHAVKLGVRDRIIFEGFKDPWPYYRSAHLFMQTSKFEGYGMAFAEAALSGCPVISTDVGLAREMGNGGAASVCPVGDKECLVKSVERLMDSNARAVQKIAMERVIRKHVLSLQEYLARQVSVWNAMIKKT